MRACDRVIRSPIFDSLSPSRQISTILALAGSRLKTLSSITTRTMRNAFRILRRLVLRTRTARSSRSLRCQTEVLDPGQPPLYPRAVLQQAGALSLHHHQRFKLQRFKLQRCERPMPSAEIHHDRDLTFSIRRRVFRRRRRVPAGLLVRKLSWGLNQTFRHRPFPARKAIREWRNLFSPGMAPSISRRCMHQCRRWPILDQRFNRNLLVQG